MASYAAYCFLLAIALMVVDCTAQSTPTSCTPFALGTRQMMFDNCTSLGTLNATLQWTYDATTGNLDTGFSAPPSTADGWVAWGINPSPSAGMAGTQAIISFTNDTRVAKTYNISGYSQETVVEGEISIDTSDISTESTGNMVIIFAKWMLERNTMMFNATWQVGPMKSPGLLSIHGTTADNLNAYAIGVSLATDGGGASSPMAPGPSPMAPGPSPMAPGPSPMAPGSSPMDLGSSGNMNMINFGAALLSSFVFFWLCCSGI